MIDACYEYMTSLYIKSVIPVVMFSDKMDILWYNKSFANYFPDRSIKNQNMSAITMTQMKKKLFLELLPTLKILSITKKKFI